MPSSYKAESKATEKAGAEGQLLLQGWGGRVQLSLPHVTHVPVLVELVEVVSVPGERAEPR